MTEEYRNKVHEKTQKVCFAVVDTLQKETADIKDRDFMRDVLFNVRERLDGAFDLADTGLRDGKYSKAQGQKDE